MNWVLCMYCGKEWEEAAWRKRHTCSKCGETRSFRVLKVAPKHNKYYEDEDERDGETNTFPGFED